MSSTITGNYCSSDGYNTLNSLYNSMASLNCFGSFIAKVISDFAGKTLKQHLVDGVLMVGIMPGERVHIELYNNSLYKSYIKIEVSQGTLTYQPLDPFHTAATMIFACDQEGIVDIDAEVEQVVANTTPYTSPYTSIFTISDAASGTGGTYGSGAYTTTYTSNTAATTNYAAGTNYYIPNYYIPNYYVNWTYPSNTTTYTTSKVPYKWQIKYIPFGELITKLGLDPTRVKRLDE